jgi:hypothetical protein
VVKFGRAQLARELVEHGIDHAGLLGIDEGAGLLEVFGVV